MEKSCIFLALLLASLSGCVDPIERDIERLAEEGEAATEARQRLNRTKLIDTLHLIRAFRNKDHPSRTRVDLVEALYQLYLREEDRRVLRALIEGLEDPDAVVRTRVAWTLGDLRTKQAVGPLINQLVGEGNDGMRYQILAALEKIETEEGPISFSSQIKTDHMTEKEKGRLTHTLVQMAREESPDSLRLKTADWLEVLAAEKALEARAWAQKGDRQWAEKLLLAARDLIPDSKNVNWQLGRFYYENGAVEKGLRILAASGLLARARQLTDRPRIDGVLDEDAWKRITPLKQFYQCAWKARAYPIAGKAEIYLGYQENELYIGIVGYEPSTENLAVAATERDDSKITRDDCLEIFLDTNHDYQTYYHILVNSAGALADQYNDGSSRVGDVGWDGPFEAAATVEDTFWTVEIRIPAHQFDRPRIQRGDIWGLNIARVRVANSPDYAQWAPTYGSAHRPDRFGFLVFD